MKYPNIHYINFRSQCIHMYYDSVMFSISGNDSDSFRNVSCFVSLDAAFYYSTFYDLLEMFNQEFRLSQHSTGNWKSVISIGMSDGGHKKGWAWFKLTTRETKRSDKTKYK